MLRERKSTKGRTPRSAAPPRGPGGRRARRPAAVRQQHERGIHAIRAVAEGEFGVMVALRSTDIVRVPIAEAVSQLKLVPPARYAEAEVFFG